MQRSLAKGRFCCMASRTKYVLSVKKYCYENCENHNADNDAYAVGGRIC